MGKGQCVHMNAFCMYLYVHARYMNTVYYADVCYCVHDRTGQRKEPEKSFKTSCASGAQDR